MHEAGIETWRVLFPKGMDANEYAMKVTPADKSLTLLLQQAQWLGKGIKGTAPGMAAPPSAPAIVQKEAAPGTASSPRAKPASSLAAQAAAPAPSQDSADALPAIVQKAATAPAAPQAAPITTPTPTPTTTPKGELLLTLGHGEDSRHWRIRGWQKNLAPEVMRVNVQVRREETAHAPASYHVDTLDIYSAKQRAAYVKQAADELDMAEDPLKRDIGAVLLQLEALQDAALTEALAPKSEVPLLTAPEQAAALDLLQSPDLIARITQDMAACGIVGESSNVLAGYGF